MKVARKKITYNNIHTKNKRRSIQKVKSNPYNKKNLIDTKLDQNTAYHIKKKLIRFAKIYKFLYMKKLIKMFVLLQNRIVFQNEQNPDI